jgi:hypothetical protein
MNLLKNLNKARRHSTRGILHAWFLEIWQTKHDLDTKHNKKS